MIRPAVAALILFALASCGCSAPPAVAPKPERGADALDAYTAGTWTALQPPGPDGGAVQCADGSAAYVAVNPAASPTSCVVMILIGQGICWTDTGYATCIGAGTFSTPHADTTHDFTTAANGWEEAKKGPLVTGENDRANGGAFSACHMLAVSTCDNSGWSGTASATYGTTTRYHYGTALRDATLAWAAGMHPSPEPLIVYGYSSGGMAAQLSAAQIAATWPSATRIGIFDSATFPPSPYWSTASQDAAASKWGATWPNGCSTLACVSSWAPSQYARVGLVGGRDDTVLSTAFSGPSPDDPDLTCLAPGSRCDYGQHVVSPASLPAVQQWMSDVQAANGNVSTMLVTKLNSYNWPRTHVSATGRKAQGDAGGPMNDDVDGGSCTVPSWIGGIVSGAQTAPCAGSVP